MKLDVYQPLLQNLPVRQQSFTTKRSNWAYAEKSIEWLEKLNIRLFQNHPTIELSRQDIFSHEGTERDLVVKVIYWGYPNGMRGNNFLNILRHMAPLEDALNRIKSKTRPDSTDYEFLVSTCRGIPGLWMSTFSKILYFMGISFNGYPCLILDQRLIDVFSGRVFSDFSDLSSLRYGNSSKQYLSYLRIMSNLADRLGTHGEKIEQFLFIFGNNLKPLKDCFGYGGIANLN